MYIKRTSYFFITFTHKRVEEEHAIVEAIILLLNQNFSLGSKGQVLAIFGLFLNKSSRPSVLVTISTSGLVRSKYVIVIQL